MVVVILEWVYDIFILIGFILITYLSWRRCAFICLVSKMDDERRTMYDRFSDIGKHSIEWVRITKEFLKLAFAGSRHEASCPCSRCENRRMLSEYEMPWSNNVSILATWYLWTSKHPLDLLRLNFRFWLRGVYRIRKRWPQLHSAMDGVQNAIW
jgi:hypothetical protein